MIIRLTKKQTDQIVRRTLQCKARMTEVGFEISNDVQASNLHFYLQKKVGFNTNSLNVTHSIEIGTEIWPLELTNIQYRMSYFLYINVTQ